MTESVFVSESFWELAAFLVYPRQFSFVVLPVIYHFVCIEATSQFKI